MSHDAAASRKGMQKVRLLGLTETLVSQPQKKSAGPKFVRYFGPVLDALRTLGGSGRPVEVQDLIAERFKLTESEQAVQLKSGSPRFANQVNWARFYLAKAGLIDASTRGVWSLTEKGRDTKLDADKALGLFRELHQRFAAAGTDEADDDEKEVSASGRPEGKGPGAAASKSYRSELLVLLKSLSPGGFEQLCQRLLRESGFEQVVVTGRSGDGGLDGNGVLQVNPFVSFRVYFQCKRYKESVGPSAVRDFRGAMQGRADKGIIISTGVFTSDARKEALRDGVPPIELVDGEKLLDMFEQLELGLRPVKTYELEPSFFDEFRAPK